MSKIIIGRAINGISINGLEYLLDDNGVERKFNSPEEAETFLAGYEIPLDSVTLVDAETFQLI